MTQEKLITTSTDNLFDEIRIALLHPKLLRGDLVARLDSTRHIISQLAYAVNLYKKWADKGDYPHDEEGCIAHAQIINAARLIGNEKI